MKMWDSKNLMKSEVYVDTSTIHGLGGDVTKLHLYLQVVNNRHGS